VRSYRRHLLRIQRTTHLPPGTSKWNKIEHRLFSQITLNWLLLARFWAGVLGWELAEDRRGGIALLPSDDIGFRIRVLQTLELKSGQNQLLFDLTSTSLEDQQQTVARLLGLGARHIDIGQRPEEGHVVLADPEGNEFCVIEPGNNFLADCGFIGAVACDAWVERNSLPLSPIIHIMSPPRTTPCSSTTAPPRRLDQGSSPPVHHLSDASSDVIPCASLSGYTWHRATPGADRSQPSWADVTSFG